MKIVVFDLDETLGYFTQFGIFWDSLIHYFKTKNVELSQNEFNYTLDLFPEFLRPNIIHILLYLKNKKKGKHCHKMMIYTNNNGPREWANHIISYFERKIHFKLIDQLIAAFKINGQKVEICRTTHNKTHQDFIKCTKIPHDTKICFMDDTFYPEMTNDNIYYINVKPYYCDLPFDEMLERFKNSDIGAHLIQVNNVDSKEFYAFMIEHIKGFNYEVIEKEDTEYEIDVILGKHIITHLQTFFNHFSKNKTLKNREHNKHKKNKNKTYKNT